MLQELAEFLLKSNSIRFGLFKLSSGKESTYYIDLRTLPSFPTYFKMAINALKERVEQHVNLDSIDYICTIPTAGLLYASALAYTLDKGMIYVRFEPKDHGTTQLLEGYLKPGSNVLLLDDVVTTGRSLLHAASVVRSNGGIVEYALVLIDRCEGASRMLEGNGIRLVSVARIDEIAEILYNSNMLEEDMLKAIRLQIRDQNNLSN
jgi:orotate phosphoribosyltransferase